MSSSSTEKFQMTRPTYDRVCQCCGAAFIAGHPGAKWCSVNCRVQAYYCRKRGEAIRPAYANPYAVDAHPPIQWQEQSAPGHEARVWAGTAITRCNRDGYVNASAMCQANGREWFTYARSDRTIAYVQALRDHLGWIPEDPNASISPAISAPELIRSITTGPNDLRGTWVHPRLAVDLARWISPQFAVWMDGWFLEAIAQPKPIRPAPLPHGVHVVATSKRHAYWLWMTAVENEVGAALMHHRHNQTSYQLHLSA